MDLPRIGRPAPPFKGKAVLNDRVFDISSSDYENKYLVLIFFPMNFAHVCPTELIAFSDHLKDFEAINTSVVACSIESHLSHQKWLSIPHRDGGIRGVQLPLIADKTMTIARDYGVLNAEEGIAYRALFIIDNKGILRQITINDRPVGRSVPETYRLIKAIQHVELMRETPPSDGVPQSNVALNINALYVSDDLAPKLDSPKHRSFQCSEKNLLRDLTE